MSTPIPSRQEMLDRAVRGLRAQGFTPCVANGQCTYDDFSGKKCAWGHVDPEGTKGQLGTVDSLRAKGIGLVAQLSLDDFHFASVLQIAHDCATKPTEMVSRLRGFAVVYGLTYPEPEEHEPKDPS